MTYEQALEFIHSRIHLGTRKGLFRMEGVMEKLGMTRTGCWRGRKNRLSDEDRGEYQYELDVLP